MNLSVDFVVDAREVAAKFEVPEGQTLTLSGPNGSGKSTALDVIAGLLRPDRGHVRLGDRALTGTRRLVPPHERQVALLAQRPLLFPHLTVLQNVAFGPRSTGVDRRRSRQRAELWLERVDAVELASRRPSELSGGQAQRVALARALAPEPQVLLLDEPLAGLDATAVPYLRALLVEVTRDRTTVLVSHDPEDRAMADLEFAFG